MSHLSGEKLLDAMNCRQSDSFSVLYKYIKDYRALDNFASILIRLPTCLLTFKSVYPQTLINVYTN